MSLVGGRSGWFFETANCGYLDGAVTAAVAGIVLVVAFRVGIEDGLLAFLGTWRSEFRDWSFFAGQIEPVGQLRRGHGASKWTL